ncbi:hypothetical protein CR513_44098, partial [Mucuna pruriens]
MLIVFMCSFILNIHHSHSQKSTCLPENHRILFIFGDSSFDAGTITISIPPNFSKQKILCWTSEYGKQKFNTLRSSRSLFIRGEEIKLKKHTETYKNRDGKIVNFHKTKERREKKEREKSRGMRNRARIELELLLKLIQDGYASFS